MDDIPALFWALGLAVLLGLLVGLQREVAKTKYAGMRTFALVSLFGALCGLLAERFGGWVLAAGFAGIVAVILVGNFSRLPRCDAEDSGTTTEVAMLLMFALGGYLVIGDWGVAIAVGGALAVLLEFKPQLHGLAQRLETRDLKAIMQFVLITFIILPVLPDRAYGPLEVFNPFEVWLMVTLIVGISLGGYLVYKFFGGNAGVLLGGFLGGAISSTATTLAYARRARQNPEVQSLAALVIALASAVVFVRVLLEIAAVAPRLLPAAVAPLLGAMLLSLLPAGAFWWRLRHRSNRMPEPKNPTELGAALSMALLYVVILFIVAATREYVGQDALYGVAVISGLTDVDAITLSLARMTETGNLAQDSAWRLILTAILSNLVFKAAMAAALGGWRLLAYLALLFAVPLLGGAAMVVLWPEMDGGLWPWLDELLPQADGEQLR